MTQFTVLLLIVTVVVMTTIIYEQRIHSGSDRAGQLRPNSRSVRTIQGEPSHITLCRAILERNSKKSNLVVIEDESFCLGESPYSSLLQIFASSFLFQASKDRSNISYDHRCGRHISTHPQNPTVQMKLVNPLELDTEGIGLSEIDHICSRCLQGFDNMGNASPNCILFTPVATKARPKNAIQAIFPSMRQQLRDAAKISQVYASPHQAEAVIYLSCDMAQCESDFPLHVFARDIPRSVESIDIIIDRTYMTRFGTSPVEKLMLVLHDIYPTAKVDWDIEVSSAASYSRMIQTKYLICESGLACWLPALVTTNHASVRNNPSLRFWFQSLGGAEMKHIKMYDGVFQPSDCLDLRGRLGSWKADEGHAVSNTYKWTETVFHSCAMNILNLSNFCQVLDKLEIHRLFFLGDGTVFEQYSSLLILLGNEPPPSDTLHSQTVIQCPSPQSKFKITYARNDKLLEKNLDGPGSGFLDNCDKPPAIVNEQKCNNWSDSYKEYPGRQLLLAHTGVYYTHHIGSFRTALQNFVTTVEEFNRPRDIHLFRTSNPTYHPGCQPENYQVMSSKREQHQFTDDYLRARRDSQKGNGGVAFDVLDVSFHDPDRRPTPGATHEIISCSHNVDWWNHLMFNNLVDMMDQERMQLTKYFTHFY